MTPENRSLKEANKAVQTELAISVNFDRIEL